MNTIHQDHIDSVVESITNRLDAAQFNALLTNNTEKFKVCAEIQKRLFDRYPGALVKSVNRMQP